MSDRRRGAAPGTVEAERGRFARCVIIALGLVGFVMFPGAWPSPSGPGIGVRTGAAQPPAHQSPGRGRAVIGAPGGSGPIAPPAETRPASSAAPPHDLVQVADPAVPPGGGQFSAPDRRLAARPQVRAAVAGLPVPATRGRAPPGSTGS
ncbi:hypothetical protein [Thermomonospora umbrina]|nr:hypothetical protein [Thermomonospora umbrina]